MTSPQPKSALFISYDGLTDPLGRSQILPYLQGLVTRGHRIRIISCEKPDKLRAEGDKLMTLCSKVGIGWHPLPYHKQPPILSSIYDVTRMSQLAARLHRAEPVDLVHCRALLPALAGLHMRDRFGVQLLFDTRAFWADEKVDGGYWDRSSLVYGSVYRYFKRKESELYATSDQVVVLTRAAERELLAQPEFRDRGNRLHVIPTCVDFDHFPLATPERRRAGRAKLGISDDRAVLCYLGSLGGNYMLSEMLDLYRAYRDQRRGALFLFVTRDDPAMIRSSAASRGVLDHELMIRPAGRDEVPEMLAAVDVGVAFKQPVYSSRACSPTKLGEMLAVGVPVIANRGVGDVEQVLGETGTGVVVNGFGAAELSRAVSDVLSITMERKAIRRAATGIFDLDDGVKAYDRIYTSADRPASRSS